MRLVPVFILKMHNQTNYKCLPKFVHSDNASSSIKTASLSWDYIIKLGPGVGNDEYIIILYYTGSRSISGFLVIVIA